MLIKSSLGFQQMSETAHVHGMIYKCSYKYEYIIQNKQIMCSEPVQISGRLFVSFVSLEERFIAVGHWTETRGVGSHGTQK